MAILAHTSSLSFSDLMRKFEDLVHVPYDDGKQFGAVDSALRHHRSVRFAITCCLLCLSISSAAGATEREECRASKDREEIILCIERGLYDPCDDSGGKWGAAQCAGAHTDIAERRIKKSEDVIASLLKDSKAARATYVKFQESQNLWRSFRDSYCRFTNEADDLKQFEGPFLQLGYCWRRLTEQRADELEALLKNRE